MPSSPDFGEEDDVAVERDVLPLEHQHHHQPGDEVVLVVHRAAAVDVAAVASRAERRMRPLLRVDVDDVGVAHDEERPLPATALEAGDDVRPVRLEREDLDRNALGVEAPSSGTRPPASRCPGGSVVSMRTSAWKCRSVSSSIFVAAVGLDVWGMVVRYCQEDGKRHGAHARNRSIGRHCMVWLQPTYMFWSSVRLQPDCRALHGK